MSERVGWPAVVFSLRGKCRLGLRVIAFMLPAILSLPMLRAADKGLTGVEVLAKALEVRGGRDAWLGVRSFHASGTVHFETKTGPWRDGSDITNVWPLEVFAMRPGKLRFAVDLTSTRGASSVFVPPRYYGNGFDGQTAWEQRPGWPAQTLPDIFQQERCEAARFFGWFADPTNYCSVTNMGVTDFEGQACYELKLVRPSGNAETHYYNATNWLLAGIVRSSVFGPSLERFVFKDYREFARFKFPMRIEYKSEDERDWGHVRAAEQLNNLEVNAVDLAVFTRPVKGMRLEALQETFTSAVTAADVKTMLRDWVDDDRVADGIVVGLVDDHKRWVVDQGTIGNESGTGKFNGDTPFGIASISKVFARLLLLDMVQRGEMKLDDPAQLYLPSVHLPTHNGKQITLLHLATHTSGLPRYFSGSEQEVYAAVSGCKLERDPGDAYEYSNAGMGLLGKALENKAGKSYKELIAERVCRPLGLHDTSVMDFDFPGVDGIKTTANDLVKFGAACAAIWSGPPRLAALMQHLYATHGGSGGNGRTYLIIDPIRRRALVALAITVDGNYEGALLTLDRLILNQSPKPSGTVAIDGHLYDRFLGPYLSGDNSVWIARRQDNRLLLQKPRGPAYEVFPLAETHFLNQMTGLDAVFVPASSEDPARLLLHDQASPWNWQGSRISSEVSVGRAVITLPRATAEDCAGQYKDSEGNVVVIRFDGAQFTAQMKGGARADPDVEGLIPESASCFKSASSPAGWTFVTDDGGKVTSVIRHMYESHTRYAKFAPPPPRVAQADTDRFLGVWEAIAPMTGHNQIHIVIKIFRTNDSYLAAIDVPEKGIAGVPIKALTFLDSRSLFFWASYGQELKFNATLDNAATQFSGNWQEGQYSAVLIFKRTTEQPLPAEGKKSNKRR